MDIGRFIDDSEDSPDPLNRREKIVSSYNCVCCFFFSFFTFITFEVCLSCVKIKDRKWTR